MQRNSLFKSLIVGDNHLSSACAEILLAHEQPIIAFISESIHIKIWANQHNIPYFKNFENFINDPLSKQSPFDYLFSIVNLKILPASILKLPSKLAINYHDSLLPKYAGLHSTSWALLNRETQHGITWHIMTESIDEGD